MAAPTTPRKTCVLGDVCICCGFSFAQIEVKTDGERITHKFYECKLKLNALKLANIRNVCDFSLNDLLDNTTGAATGICRKCDRTINSILKAEEKNNALKKLVREKLQQTYATNVIHFSHLPSPRQRAEKRMLRTPDSGGRGKLRPPQSETSTFVSVSYVSPCKIKPFAELTNLPRPIAPKPHEVKYVLH